MKIKLSYQNVKDILPFTKAFLFSLTKINKPLYFISFIYIMLSLVFFSYFSSIVKVTDLVTIYVSFFILHAMYFLYVVVVYKKFNQKIIEIDLEEGCVTLPKKPKRYINRKKSMVIHHHEVLLVIDIKVRFANVAIPITDHCCDSDTLYQLSQYISS